MLEQLNIFTNSRVKLLIYLYELVEIKGIHFQLLKMAKLFNILRYALSRVTLR